jgi:predicted Zn-dependent protease
MCYTEHDMQLRAISIFIPVIISLAAALSCSSSRPAGDPRFVFQTAEDETRVGRQGAAAVESELGLLGDDELDAYLDSIGQRVLHGLGRARFEYSFRVVNEAQPNAFIRPGGFVFLTRGLLVLLNDEDELACVLGHEIIHVEQRHTPREQAVDDQVNPVLGPWNRVAQRARYTEPMEREADLLGQGLCAAAGYDPIAMSTLLRSLRQVERIRFGFSRGPTFLDTHPSIRERAAINSSRAGKIAWQRDPRIGDPRAALLRRTDGIDVGQRPQSGVFVENRFLQPALGFQISFPSGWELSANNRVVSGRSPDTGAIVFLTADQPAGDPQTRADEWFSSLASEGVSVESSRGLSVGRRPAWRFELSTGGRLSRTTGTATFVSHGDLTYRLIAIAPTRAARRDLPRTLTAIRSFRRLSAENRIRIRARRLRMIEAEPNESLVELGTRAGDTWVPTRRAVMNGLFSNHVFQGSELAKIARSEPYHSEPAADPE